LEIRYLWIKPEGQSFRNLLQMEMTDKYNSCR